MQVESHYSKSFHSEKLTRQKYDSLVDHAVNLREVRNELSVVVNSGLLKYLEMSKIDFQKAMLPLIKDRVHSNFTKQLCGDVHKDYQNRFVAVKDRMRFNGPTVILFNYYKRNVPAKGKRKGDLKSIERVSKSTPLSKVLSFLARHGSEDTLDYIRESMTSCTVASKVKFYQSVIDMCDRFGYDRLLRLALMRRENTLRKYSKPIEYKSLSFRGRSRIKKDIVSLNENDKSVIRAFVEVSWLNRNETITIPVRHSYKWHGRNLSEYTNGTDTSYTVCFVEKYKQVRFVLQKKGLREYADVDEINEARTVGFDINTKHSQLVGSDLDIQLDHNRVALDKLADELKRIDELKSMSKGYAVGKKRQARIDTLRRSVVEYTRRNCSDICKRMISNGYNHAVFENLDNSFGKSFGKTKEDINFNRLVKEMKLSSVKDEFEHIARNGKHDEKGTKIAVSFVHAEYTSQECSECHFIDEGNRTTQESFKCLECGHEENADNNASCSVKKRLTRAVRGELLSAENVPGGAFRPKTFNRKRVRSILLTFREAHHSSENRFDETDQQWQVLPSFA